MTYKIGDKVKIREWDDLAEECGTDSRGYIRVNERTYINNSMKNCCGKETTILGEDADGDYNLAIDGGRYFWSEYALLPVEEKDAKYNIGDKVKIREWDDLVAEYGVDHKGSIRPEEGLITSHMKDYCGKEAEVRFRPNFNGSYKLEIDGKYYLWPACALLPVEENVAKYKIGDKVNATVPTVVQSDPERFPEEWSERTALTDNSPIITERKGMC